MASRIEEISMIRAKGMLPPRKARKTVKDQAEAEAEKFVTSRPPSKEKRGEPMDFSARCVSVVSTENPSETEEISFQERFHEFFGCRIHGASRKMLFGVLPVGSALAGFLFWLAR